jgi:hypothetical protein
MPRSWAEQAYRESFITTGLTKECISRRGAPGALHERRAHRVQVVREGRSS